jgi:hypothetical protein
MMKKIVKIFPIVLGLLLFKISYAQTISFSNPLSFTTLDGPNGLLANILNNVEGIIVVLALIFLVVGAILYITSAGNDRRMQTSKGAIFAALIGLAIALAARSFLKEIADILGWTGAVPVARSLGEIAVATLNFLLGIVGTIAIIMMVVGGIMYLTSAGDDDRMKTGKKIFIYSIVGITIALASIVIVRQVASLIVSSA